MAAPSRTMGNNERSRSETRPGPLMTMRRLTSAVGVAVRPAQDNAAVLRTPLCRGVVGNGLALAKALRREAARGHAPCLQVVGHRAFSIPGCPMLWVGAFDTLNES